MSSAATDTTEAAGDPAELATPGWAPWAWYAAMAFPVVLGFPWLYFAAGSELPEPLGSLNGLILCGLLAVITVTDIRWSLIPNWVTYTTIGWAGLLHAVVAVVPTDATLTLPTFAGERTATIREWLTAVEPNLGLVGFGAGLVVMGGLYWVFQGGAADVKLLVAIGAIVGAERVFAVIALGFVVAAVGAAAYIMWVAGPAGFVAKKQMSKTTPLGPFLATGVILALFWRS